jgi:hypothetical protein
MFALVCEVVIEFLFFRQPLVRVISGKGFFSDTSGLLNKYIGLVRQLEPSVRDGCLMVSYAKQSCIFSG